MDKIEEIFETFESLNLALGKLEIGSIQISAKIQYNKALDRHE